MTTVVSNSAALVAACSESRGPAETRYHLLPFFAGLPCLAEMLHCPDGPSESGDLKLRVKANIRETLFFFFCTLGPVAHIR